MRRISSHLLWTPQGFVKRPLVTLDALTREVLAIGQYDSAELDATEGVEFYAGILTAGFINAHCHSELAPLQGAIAPGGGFAAFGGAVGAKRAEFTREQTLRAIREAEGAMYAEGVDAVGDIVNDDSSFEIKRESAIRYRSFAEVFGLRSSNEERCRELLIHPETSLTPHSTYSVQDASFRRVCSEPSDAPLSIHFMESEGEAQLYRGEGDMHRWYSQVGFSCDFLHYGSPAGRIIRCVPRDRSVMLVHNCFVTEQVVDSLLAHFTAPLYWVLCPRSNRYISGIEPRSVELLRRKGCNICIGTDSPASNESLSIIEELKCFKGVPLDELLGWATHNGAAALGYDDTLGTIAEGRKCGLVVISGVDMTTMSLTPSATARRIL